MLFTGGVPRAAERYCNYIQYMGNNARTASGVYTPCLSGFRPAHAGSTIQGGSVIAALPLLVEAAVLSDTGGV